MSQEAVPRQPTFRLSLALWLVGMAGVLSMLQMPLPESIELSMPLWRVRVLSLIQPVLLLTLAVWAGVKLAPKVGLHAPAFEALVQRSGFASALRPQIAPGVATGILGGIALALVGFFTPDALADVEFDPPLAMRLLFGGITEELLVRWGLMTSLLWAGSRLSGTDAEGPTAGLLWGSIILSSLAFGASHLPAAFVFADEVTVGLLVYVVGANSGFGMLFGYLFWKCGLEASMIAHALTHLVAFLVALTPFLS